MKMKRSSKRNPPARNIKDVYYRYPCENKASGALLLTLPKIFCWRLGITNQAQLEIRQENDTIVIRRASGQLA